MLAAIAKIGREIDKDNRICTTAGGAYADDGCFMELKRTQGEEVKVGTVREMESMMDIALRAERRCD